MVLEETWGGENEQRINSGTFFARLIGKSIESCRIFLVYVSLFIETQFNHTNAPDIFRHTALTLLTRHFFY